jgi:hypothetical protein
MGGEHRRSPSSLRQSGHGLHQVSQQVHQEWQKLRSTAQGMGDIFGDDMVGGLIGSAYHAIEDVGNDTFTSAGDDFQAMGDGLTTVADRHEEMERAHAGLLDQIDGSM